MGNDCADDRTDSNRTDRLVGLYLLVVCCLTLPSLAFPFFAGLIAIMVRILALGPFAIITIPAFLFPTIPLTLQLFLPLILRFDLLDPLIMTALLLFHLTIIVLLAPS